MSLGLTTTYTYDNQNRPVAFSLSNGSKGSYLYDDGLKRFTEITYVDVVRQESTLTRLPYQFNGSNFSTSTYRLPTQAPLFDTQYQFDSDKHLLAASTLRSGTATGGSYVTQGENVVSSNVNQMRFRQRFTYKYDANINPFYGLVGPTLDEFDPSIDVNRMTEILPFSRNNIIEATGDATNDGFRGVIKYEYTYNANGLPITLKIMGNVSKEYRFAYESY